MSLGASRAESVCCCTSDPLRSADWETSLIKATAPAAEHITNPYWGNIFVAFASNRLSCVAMRLALDYIYL